MPFEIFVRHKIRGTDRFTGWAFLCAFPSEISAKFALTVLREANPDDREYEIRKARRK